jgi:hypothetical protein
MASDIEQFAIAPMVEMALDFLMQYIDTSNDPRIASILGVDAVILAGLTQPEIMELVQGDYEIQVQGLTGQLEKAETLQNLVQLMNLIGQNPEAWIPWIKQDELLRRVLDSFRPAITDIEDILNDPQTAAATQASMQQASQQAQMARIIPQLAEIAHKTKQDAIENDLAQAEIANKHVDQAIELRKADAAVEKAKQRPTGSSK